MKKLLFILMLIVPTIAISQDHYQTVRFTLKDVLEVVAEYDIRHYDIPVPEIGYHGWTHEPGAVIRIFKLNNSNSQYTLIHEILHVLSNKRELKLTEEEIAIHSEHLYREIFLSSY